jgi:Tol biopolymer transport system component
MNSCRDRYLLAVALLFLLAATLGAEEKQLTTDGRLKSDPVFVDRSGKELVFVVQDRPVQTRLMRLKLADGSTTPLFPDQTKSEFEPSFSDDGRLLAFVQSRGNLSLALVIRDTSNGKETDVKPGGGFAGPRSPAVSPDGKTVLYSFAEGGKQQIISVNRDAAERRVLIDSPGINNWPSFSPDGKQIVFASTRDGDYEIYTVAADGSGVRRLTNSPRQDIRPRFSPDGKRIAFTSNRDGNYEIYVMNADGSGLKRVTDNLERDDYATWHPDGKRLVIVSERKGKHDLYLVDVP